MRGAGAAGLPAGAGLSVQSRSTGRRGRLNVRDGADAARAPAGGVRRLSLRAMPTGRPRASPNPGSVGERRDKAVTLGHYVRQNNPDNALLRRDMAGPSHVNPQPTEVVTQLSGYHLLADSYLNKGTAFSDKERDAFELHGLLPPQVATLDEQVSRRLQALRGFATDLERYAFLRELQDTNETVFYALLTRNIEELLPIAYTPTVGAGCQHFSRLFRKPRGVFPSLKHRKGIKQIFENPYFDV